jgi:transposase
LEGECQRNVELMWLTGRLVPDFKTITDFRRDNGQAIRNVCSQFVMLCRWLDLFAQGRPLDARRSDGFILACSSRLVSDLALDF